MSQLKVFLLRSLTQTFLLVDTGNLLQSGEFFFFVFFFLTVNETSLTFLGEIINGMEFKQMIWDDATVL